MNNRLIGEAFAAETLNLLTESNLTAVFGCGDVFKDSIVHDFMEIRLSTLKLRFGLPLTKDDESCIKIVFGKKELVDRLFACPCDPALMCVSESPTPEAAQARYEALAERLKISLSSTRYADRCRHADEEAERESVRFALTNW